MIRLLGGILLQLLLMLEASRAFVTHYHRTQRIPVEVGRTTDAATVLGALLSRGENKLERLQPTACLTGYVSDDKREDLEQALRAVGFEIVSEEEDASTTFPDCYSYSWSAATGMLKLAASPPAENSRHESTYGPLPPIWIPVVKGEEKVLLANGWSFLDVDESEKLSPFDVDAANEEGLYRPKWGQEDGAVSGILSLLGFLSTPLTTEQVESDGAGLHSDLSRHVLLEGATDPRGTKTTHNGYSFAGSVQHIEPGIFVCAIGGLPLFSTSDISPSTAANGWLSFVRPLSPDHVTHIEPATDATDQRVEVVCSKSGCHLGHYFGKSDGYCINASALNFSPVNPVNTGSDEGSKFVVAAPASYRSLEAAEETQRIKLLRIMLVENTRTSSIVVGAGCFWHAEFALRRLVGIVDTVAGFAGGTRQCPSYESVCEGQTGHAEVVFVEFDSQVLDPRVLIDCFLALHDPTKVKAHGKHAAGIGQYRSSVFLPSCETGMKEIVREALDDCESQLQKALSTEVRVMTSNVDDWFWTAEERHQRRDERRNKYKAEDLSTLSAFDWLELYGRRSASIIGSSQTMNSAVIE